MFSTFKQANEYLETLIPKEYKTTQAFKLERISYLLGLLGNPHQKLKFIHITGTSGKGSVAYYLSQILSGQGYKIGLHISPHLQEVTERMQINGEMASKEKFVGLVNEIKPLVNQVDKDLRLGKPTYFETLVALAFEHFFREKVNIAIVEVGLGGKLDATNVISPLVSIITNVGLDHTDILGDTVEKIARDKSGIIKEGSPVVSGARQLAVRKIIAKKCVENKSRLFLINKEFDYKIKKVDFSGVIFDFSWLDKAHPCRLSTPASYQVENAALALAAVYLLKDSCGFKINEERLYKSLETAKVPGRFEIISQNPLIILDGAHNPVKIRTFIYSLKKIIPNKKFIFLVAFKKDKDIEKMLKILKPYAKAFVVTQFNQVTDMGRNLTTPAEEIEKILKKLYRHSGDERSEDSRIFDQPSKKDSGQARMTSRRLGTRRIIVEKNSKAALEKAKAFSAGKISIVVTGSLYLVGEIRDIFFPNK